MTMLLCVFYLGILTLPFIVGQELHILVTSFTTGRILLVTLASNNTIELVSNGTSPVAVDFDPGEDLVYWTDGSLRQIRTSSLKGLGDREVLQLNNASVPDGLAIDASTRQIFYTDAGNKHVAVVDMNGTNHKIIINKTVDQPRAIVLHQEKRLIYWTDWGDSALIATADYDGNNRRHIVTSGLIWPTGLALDKKNNMLYWCDGHSNTVESVGVDGKGRTVLIKDHKPARFFDIFLHSGALYLTDLTENAIIVIPANGSISDTVGLISNPHMTNLTSIHVYSSVDYSGCPDERYGQTCQACNECKEHTVCEKTTGHCLAGCTPGYREYICDKKCDPGKYGEDCSSPCGMCANGDCHHVTGTCTSGCMPGFEGQRCNDSIQTDELDHDIGPSIAVIIGITCAGLFVVLIIVLVIGVVIYIRRNRTPRTHETPTYFPEMVNSAYNIDPPPVYSTINDFQMNQPGYTNLRRMGNSPSPNPHSLYTSLK